MFGWFTDFGMWVVAGIPTPNYFTRMTMVLIGIIILGFGISLSVTANVILNSGEAFVKAISDTTHKEFGNVKIAFDVTCVSLAAVLSLIFFDLSIVGTRVGTKRALLIDSGLTVTNAREIAEGLTDLPISLLNTHSDQDHIASNHQFESFYMHEAESFFYFNIMHKTGELIPLKDGEIIDLGDRPLEIVTLPGHTPGSVGVLDINQRVLISGDPIQDGMIFMFGPGRDMTVYRNSLRKLDGYRTFFDTIYPSHGTFPVGKELIDQLYEVTEDLSTFPRWDMEMHDQIVDCVDTGVAKFLISK